jgi:hypothetical protein
MVRFWLARPTRALSGFWPEIMRTPSPPWPISRRGPVCFIDPFSCNGHRFKDTARFVPKGALEFVGLVARYSPSLLADRYRAMVVMHVTNELPIISPAALTLLPRPGVQSSPPKRR